MKKIFAFILCAIMLTGCNRQIVDLNYKFDKAIIDLGNGQMITVEVASWIDYENSDQLQIKSKDGKTYLVHSSDCILINE